MAELANQMPPGHWHLTDDHLKFACTQVDEHGNHSDVEQPCNDFMKNMDAERESLLALIEEERVWKTPIADGHAYYYIKSETPLVLLHIPYGDRWTAHPALIRGLNLDDVHRELAAERRLQEILNSRKS